MPFEKGNRFWEARSTHGRNPIFKSPEQLWEACLEYFQWVEDNPLWEDRPFTYQGAVISNEVAKMRAMTIAGLTIFLDISLQTWYDYKKRDDFIEVTTRVEEIIKEQKFAGAAADLLNPNIIARDLGLKDVTSKELSGPGGGPIKIAPADLADFTDEELEVIAKLGLKHKEITHQESDD